MIDGGGSRWAWWPGKWRRDAPAAQKPEAALGGIDATGLIVVRGAVERRIPWSAIRRVVAANGAGYVGDTMLLIMELADGDHLMVPETAPLWDDLVTAIDTALPDAALREAWQVRLMAAPDRPVELYQRMSSVHASEAEE